MKYPKPKNHPVKNEKKIFFFCDNKMLNKIGRVKKFKIIML